MHELDKEYKDKLHQLSNIYKDNRYDLATNRIQLFTAAITRQLIDLNQSFDLIIGSGNSGLFMSKIITIIYHHLGKDLPPILNIPLYRFQDDGTTPRDNNDLIPYVQSNIPSLPNNLEVLFIDDEIMRGMTAQISLDLLTRSLPNITRIKATIIAENHFFEWHYNLPKVTIQFFAYAKLIQGLNGNIGHFIPERLFDQIKQTFPDVESYNHAAGIVIGGALKRKDGQGVPFYDFSTPQTALEQIEGYAGTQRQIMDELQKTVEEAIRLYENKVITFKF